MSLTYSIEQRVPILTEMIFILIVGGGFTYNMANFDINQHFYYVLPEQAYCNKSQLQNPFCINLWSSLNLPQGDQADIPDKYWANLNQTATTFGVLLAVARFGGSYVISKALGIKIWKYPSKIYKIVIYAVTVTVFPLFSYGDYLYYFLQHIKLPDQWSWLDGVGIYPTILHYTGEQHVSTNDVYITMAIGLGIVILIWLPILINFKKNKGIAKQIA